MKDLFHVDEDGVFHVDFPEDPNVLCIEVIKLYNDIDGYIYPCKFKTMESAKRYAGFMLCRGFEFTPVIDHVRISPKRCFSEVA